MPIPSGALPILHLDFGSSGDTVSFTGAQLDTVAGLGLGVTTAGGVTPTFTQLLFKTDYAHGFAVVPDLGTIGDVFPNAWVETVTPDGVQIDWQPGAAKLGEVYLDIDHRPVTVGFKLEIDPASSDTTDFTAFDAAHFTVQATPEPGILVLAGSLLLSGGALVRRARKR